MWAINYRNKFFQTINLLFISLFFITKLFTIPVHTMHRLEGCINLILLYKIASQMRHKAANYLNVIINGFYIYAFQNKRRLTRKNYTPRSDYSIMVVSSLIKNSTTSSSTFAESDSKLSVSTSGNNNQYIINNCSKIKDRKIHH